MRKLIRPAGLVLGLGLLLASAGRLPAAEPPTHSEAGHGAGAGEAPHGAPLSPKADLALWSAVTFVVFLIVLRRYAWGPLISALNERESGIRSDISKAEAARLNAEKMLADHAKKLAQVQDEVRAILAEARRDADRNRQEIVSEAMKEAEAAKQRAVNEIGRARDAALKDLFDVMATEVAHATEHVLGRSVNDADQARLINEALADFPRR